MARRKRASGTDARTPERPATGRGVPGPRPAVPVGFSEGPGGVIGAPGGAGDGPVRHIGGRARGSGRGGRHGDVRDTRVDQVGGPLDPIGAAVVDRVTGTLVGVRKVAAPLTVAGAGVRGTATPVTVYAAPDAVYATPDAADATPGAVYATPDAVCATPDTVHATRGTVNVAPVRKVAARAGLRESASPAASGPARIGRGPPGSRPVVHPAVPRAANGCERPVQVAALEDLPKPDQPLGVPRTVPADDGLGGGRLFADPGVAIAERLRKPRAGGRAHDP